MWCLVSTNGTTTYYVTPNKVHKVSRRNGDLILAQDGSVSREHAEIEVKVDGVYVTDTKSKFGTYIGKGIETNTKIKQSLLREGEQIRFGLQNNIWTLKKDVPRVFIETLEGNEKRLVISILSKIGGKVVHNWREDSTHLTTNSLCLTNGVLCALASGKPIVLPSFWNHYELMTSGIENLPDASQFIPPMQDKRLLSQNSRSCLPNLERRTLFRDKLFIFPTSSSYQAYKTIVELAGGRVTLLSECKMPIEDYCQQHVVLISCSEKEQSPSYQKAMRKLLEKSYRVIPEDDIGLALWKVSVAVHCNPQYSSKNIFCMPDKSDSSLSTLVMDSEDIGVASTGFRLSDKVIPPSLSDNFSSTEDKSSSLNLRSDQPQPLPGTSQTSRKRVRENNNEKCSMDNSNKSSLKNKKKSAEEEDMFAFDCEPPKQRRNSGTNDHASITKMKEEKKSTSPADDDDFCLPSPKRKKTKQSDKDPDKDMFDLPAEPISKKARNRQSEGEEVDFLGRNGMYQSRELDQSSVLHESKDLFTQESAIDLFTPKRKNSDSERPPAKRPHPDTDPHTDFMYMHQESVGGAEACGWLLNVKKEEKIDHVEELTTSFHAAIVLTPLMRKTKQGHKTSPCTSFSNKNFKKFRKVWTKTSGSEKHYVTTSPVTVTYGKVPISRNGSNSTAEEDDREEEEDDPFFGNRPAPRGRRQTRKDDDEFALPSFSQV